MFLAPDFPDPVTGNATYILMTVAADMQIEVFQQMGTNANGSPIMTLVNTIYSPDPAEPYMFDPKAFVNCTPQCVTYVVMGLGTVAESQQTETEPNGLGVTTLLLTVPVSVATLHQFGAVLLLTAILTVVHRLSNAPRPSPELPVPAETPAS